jgi:hypothetical protein
MTINREYEAKLRDAVAAARWFPGDDPLPAVTVIIGNNTITAEYKLVNRKCYDFLPTPSLYTTINGKRISYAKLIEVVNS